MTIDREKVQRVQKILGTQTIAETVDAALEDVINHDRRNRAVPSSSSIPVNSRD